MTHTLSSVRRWRPASLTAAADAVESRTEELTAQLRRHERNLDELVVEWEGSAADAAESRVRTELAFGRRLRARLEDVEQAIRDGVPRLQSARSTLLGKVDAAVGDGFAVADDWMVTDPTTVPADEVDARQAELDGHVEAISDALSTLSTEDAQVAHAIDSALDELRATSAGVDAGLEYTPPTTTNGMSQQQVRDLLGAAAFQRWMAAHPDAAKELLDGAVDEVSCRPTTPRTATSWRRTGRTRRSRRPASTAAPGTPRPAPRPTARRSRRSTTTTASCSSTTPSCSGRAWPT